MISTIQIMCQMTFDLPQYFVNFICIQSGMYCVFMLILVGTYPPPASLSHHLCTQVYPLSGCIWLAELATG